MAPVCNQLTILSIFGARRAGRPNVKGWEVAQLGSSNTIIHVQLGHSTLLQTLGQSTVLKMSSFVIQFGFPEQFQLFN